MEEGDIYYAQLRGFLIDQFAEKSAVISWLLPTRESPPPNEGFHPATYVLGPEEEVPRKMEVIDFARCYQHCHCHWVHPCLDYTLMDYSRLDYS